MPLWLCLVVGVGVLTVVALVVAIWFYPRDNSF